ncbi:MULTISPECIES: phage tail tube protein [unclassified Stenotrophomonas]|uniref:phage tail tube protein n=1 Tax=unclassified Stenotrophomonas TaxID=196198 RepID=UPI0025D44375|nr:MULTISPECIES: phage tail tube protein [unclassified Stenotrophomonas]
MALKFPNGSVFGISTALSAAIPVSAISNANPAEATVTTGAVATDDVLVIASGWPLINNSVTVAGEVSAGDVPLRGLDTSDVTLFPAGKAAATFYKASSFVDVDQQGDPSTSGGESKEWTGTLLEDPLGREISIPIGLTAEKLTLPLYYDPKKPWYAALKAAAVKRAPVVLRCKLSDGDEIYRYGYLAFNSNPSMNANNPMQNQLTFTSQGEATLVEAE